MKYDIITIGGAVVDAFVETDVLERKGKLSYPVDAKILVEGLVFTSGGGATNTAVAFSKMGLKTGCASKIGDDNNGKMILGDLKKNKVEFLGRAGSEETGFSVILEGRDKGRTILQDKGASENLKFRDLVLSKLKTKWFYFSSSVGETLKTQKKLAVWASRRGIKIAYNPSSYLTKQGARKISGILKYCDVLILNKEEATDLVGKKDLLRSLRKLGPKIVCVTDGVRGNVVYDGDNFYVSKTRKVKVVSRTGAGDAFASGFVAGLIKSGDVVKAVQIGSVNAEGVIGKRGAKNGLLSWRGALKESRKVKVERKRVA